MSAQGYFADSDLEFINRIILLCQDRHKNVLWEVPGQIFGQDLKCFHVLRFPPLHLSKLIYVSKQCSNVFRNFVLRLT